MLSCSSNSETTPPDWTSVAVTSVKGVCSKEHCSSGAALRSRGAYVHECPAKLLEILVWMDDPDERACDLEKDVEWSKGLANGISDGRVCLRDDGPLGLARYIERKEARGGRPARAKSINLSGMVERRRRAPIGPSVHPPGEA